MVVGAIACFLVIVVAVASFVVLTKQPNSPVASTGAKTQAVFNQYTNYLINGNEDTNTIELPDKANQDNCYAAKTLASSDSSVRSEYTTKLKGLYTAFTDTAKASNILPFTSSEENSSEVNVSDQDIQNISDTLQQFSTVANVPFLSDTTLIEQFINNNNSTSAVSDYVTQYYSSLTKDSTFQQDDSMINHYYQLGIDTSSLQIQLIQTASEISCINNKQISASCFSNQGQSDSYRELNQRIENLVTYQKNFYNKYLDEILSTSNNMQQAIRSQS